MASPSDLPAASRVAQICYDSWRDIEDLPRELRDDIEQLAGHFYANDDFEKIFIRQLVPWNELVGCPNRGHATIADFLISRAAHVALSANFDPLIEHWAEERKIAMQGALTRAAKTKAPDPNTAQSAFAHMLLLNAGASKQGAWYEYEEQSIRIVNGAGQGLADVESRYKEPITVGHADIIVCAGATDLGVPANLIPKGRGESVVRPASGSGARWLTLEQAS